MGLNLQEFATSATFHPDEAEALSLGWVRTLSLVSACPLSTGFGAEVHKTFQLRAGDIPE
eukprot:3933077-Rhodomonas_salina.1